jgi:peroxin-10
MATIATNAKVDSNGLIGPHVMSPVGEFQYPFAAAPDIIRSNQKDTYLQGVLWENLSKILREIYGARFAHNYTSEIRTVTELLYLGCTTLLGNRTLGEEYCDILQIEDDTLRLPSIFRRTSFILSTTLFPYILTKSLPAFRRRLRLSLEHKPATLLVDINRRKRVVLWLKSYIQSNLSSLTSPATLYALGLSVFYFTGSYYHIGKRILRLRYVFTKRGELSNSRIGYEVLGVLLILQLLVQGILHFKSTVYNGPSSQMSTIRNDSNANEADVGPGYNIRDRENDLSIGQIPLHGSSNHNIEIYHTPALAHPRYKLSDEDIMSWMDGRQQRKCTLCLEELKDPSVTTCGHVYCWACIADWIREKPECPLCRQSLLSQHVLPLRG